METVYVNPQMDVENFVKNQSSNKKVIFKPGLYEHLTIRVEKDDIVLEGEDRPNVRMKNCRVEYRGDNGAVRLFTFEGNSSVNALFESHTDLRRCAQGFIIEQNTFKDVLDDPAKRIRVALNSKHEKLDAHCIIRNNAFRNILGNNNQGNPGGELISVKAGNCVVFGNEFYDSRGMLSIRGGRGSTVAFNKFYGSQRCGIQIYNEGHIVLRNTLDGDNVSIHVGDGDINDIDDAVEGRNHMPAHFAQVMQNMGRGKIIILKRFRRYRPEHVHVHENGAIEIDNQWD